MTSHDFWGELAGSFFDELAHRMILVLVKGGIGCFFCHPIGSTYPFYTRYILPSRWLFNPYHPLEEPESSIDLQDCWFSFLGFSSVNENPS